MFFFFCEMREMSSTTYSRYFGTLPSQPIQLANKNQLKTFFRIISRIGIGYPGYVSLIHRHIIIVYLR